MEDALGLVEGLYPGSAAAGFRNFPESATTRAPRIGEVYTKGTLTLARLGREAPIAMANPAGPVLRNVEGGSLAARSLYPEDIRHISPEALPRSPVIGTDAPVQYEQRDDIGAPRRRLPGSPSRRGTSPAKPESGATSDLVQLSGARSRSPGLQEGARVADSCGIRVRACNERRGRNRVPPEARSEARIIAGGHSLLPMMKLRLANPEHLIDINDLAELAFIREEGGEIRIGALTRHVDLLKSDLLGRALSALPRCRARDRRPGRAQPRHDRRLALPGRSGRGPLGRVLRRQGQGRDPRGRRRARRGHGGLPRRPVHDGGGAGEILTEIRLGGAPRRGQRAREGRAPRRRLGDRRRVGGGLAGRRHDRRRRHRAQRGRPDDHPPHDGPRSCCAARRPPTSCSSRRARSPRRTARRARTVAGRSTTSATSRASSPSAHCAAPPRAHSTRRPDA